MRVPGVWLLVSTLLVLGFGTFCIGIPLTAVAARIGGGGWDQLFDPETLAIVRATLAQALASLSISLLIGVPLGLWLGAPPRVSPAFLRLLAIPFSVPTLIAGLTGVLWMGKSGLFAKLGLSLDWAYSFRAVVLMHVVLNAPWVAWVTAGARMQVPESEVEAARLLGAPALARFRWVIWPSVSAAVGSVSAQVFGLCVMSFALVLLLGGGPPVETLETAIYSRMRSGFLDVSEAAAFAAWQLLLTLAPWAVLVAFRARAPQRSRITPVGRGGGGGRGGGNARRWIKAFFAALFLAPFLGLLVTTPWSRLSAETLTAPLWLSLHLAGAVSVLTVVLALAAVFCAATWGARSRWAAAVFSILLTLPAAISILVLGLGFWLAYSRWVDPFEGSLLAMTVLQTTVFFPFAYRTLWPLSQNLRIREMEAAVLLGASPFRAFRTVEWPRWRDPVLGVLAVVIAASLGEVAAVSLFYSENLVPLPLLIGRWMGQYRFEEAHALAGLLLVLSTGTLWMVRHD